MGQVQSSSVAWKLSGFGDEIDPDPAIQAAVLQALGAQHIEVRSAWGVNVVDLSDEQLGRLREVLHARGIQVSAVASPIGKVDVALDPDLEVARLRRAINVAHALETPYIRVFSFYRGEGVPVESIRDDVLGRMHVLAMTAADAGVILLHENEKDIYGDIPERVLDIVESVGSESLRLAWDSANFVQVGMRPYDDGYQMLRPYVDYLQVKDAILETGEVVPAGQGDGQLLETVTALRDDGFEGFASLEPHLGQLLEFSAFTGPRKFGQAARAFAAVTDAVGVELT